MPKIDTISSTQLLSLLKQQDYRCAVTGRELTPALATVDHRIPLGRGGDHSIANLWIVHKDVNRAKGSMMMEEFIALCRDVLSHSGDGDFAPAQADAEQMDLFHSNGDA
jgi:hypothetical protein